MSKERDGTREIKDMATYGTLSLVLSDGDEKVFESVALQDIGGIFTITQKDGTVAGLPASRIKNFTWVPEAVETMPATKVVAERGHKK